MKPEAHGGDLLRMAATAGRDPASLLDFSVNVRPEGPPEFIRAALFRAMTSLAAYPSPHAEEAMLAAARHHGMDASRFVFGSGSNELIHALARVLRKRGVPSVRVVEPAFSEYAIACRLAGIKAIPVWGGIIEKNQCVPTTDTGKDEAVPTRDLLDALTDADKTAYAALCLDDDRNRWWGYDFRKDYDGTPYEDYFLAVAREDCARSRAVNFAVRLDGALIGEVVLYRFDSRGGAELGCRVSPDFAGHGYGTEAFAAVADWALYRLHLAHVVAKCYKENDASYRMLSSCMHRAGEDETFFYFDKEV